MTTATPPRRPARPGFSLVGMLVTLVCILVLFTIGITAMNKAVTGEGNAREGTVRTTQDLMYLNALYQALFTDAMQNRDRYLVPSALTESGDIADDTTATLFSALVMGNLVDVKQLISANEQSSVVWADDDYDFRAYDARAGVYWDPDFVADLDVESNVSFAHVPLCGKRDDAHWKAHASAQFPVVGNRGPRNGVPDPASWTYGRDGTWGGHMLYGDGHIAFETSFTPVGDDNIFAMEDGPFGADAIVTFTKEMKREGPVIQFD